MSSARGSGLVAETKKDSSSTKACATLTADEASKNAVGEALKAAEDDGVDPLDAFMAGMQGEYQEDLKLTGTGVKRKYQDESTGVETSKDCKAFTEHAAGWGKTKGAVQNGLRREYNKKLNAMRGPSD
mmetsp:Transcript_14155/g.38896  ORF Transcript_14155/g.38896 Transcript_14155/m.38896 type:complete len:128 (+) Transcript_14155:64-447(+)